MRSFTTTIIIALIAMTSSLTISTKAQQYHHQQQQEQPIIIDGHVISSSKLGGTFKDTGYNALKTLAEGPFSSSSLFDPVKSHAPITLGMAGSGQLFKRQWLTCACPTASYIPCKGGLVCCPPGYECIGGGQCQVSNGTKVAMSVNTSTTTAILPPSTSADKSSSNSNPTNAANNRMEHTSGFTAIILTIAAVVVAALMA
ncbi:hypothetical protein BGZ49_002574 [Haplosporangium sp. Z 27]|nr:hypothetical protein BGZ49_002574 [Haplosporangium sp. Z 27]